MHALGVLCLAAMFAAAVYTIVSSIAPQWHRIVRLALGHVEPVFHTLFPEASSGRAPQILRDQLAADETSVQIPREAA